MITLELPYPPSVNGKFAYRKFVLTQRYRDYKTEVGWLCNRLRPRSGDVAVKIMLHYTREPDVDNFAKAILDGLNGRAWHDDKQVRPLVLDKVRTDGQPKAVVTIEYAK